MALALKANHFHNGSDTAVPDLANIVSLSMVSRASLTFASQRRSSPLSDLEHDLPSISPFGGSCALVATESGNLPGNRNFWLRSAHASIEPLEFFARKDLGRTVGLRYQPADGEIGTQQIRVLH